jgi:hypothetical protein
LDLADFEAPAMRKALVASVVLMLAAGAGLPEPPKTPAPRPEKKGKPAIDGAGLEFFEQKIRPVLVQHCYACHSVAAKKSKGGLQIDTRAALRKGGENGPAIVPGDPDKSLLIKAVRYDGQEMPPREKGKLPANVIADLERWVRMGAPDPRESAAAATAGSWEEVLKERRGWWSLQPVQRPALPEVKNAAWSPQTIDRFVLSQLEKRGLSPSAEADRRTLLRRLSLVLTGLPPTPDEIDRFLADTTPNAYEKQVDRLLASPHFGERFASHWLDVVRFSETHGNEWNYETPFAYRYRDYVVRVFNDDVPYDQFVLEQLAGDLVPSPRWNRSERLNESLIGTMFYRFGDANVEDCVLFPQIGYDVLDNQIDTLGKAFQATTIACARCHDHKLDAVSMKDYYALVGILHSSRAVSHTLDAPEMNASLLKHLKELKEEIRKEQGSVWRQDVGELARYLLAAQAHEAGAENAPDLSRGLDGERLEEWIDALVTGREDLLTPWRNAGTSWRKEAERFQKMQGERAAFNRQHYRTLVDFQHGRLEGWQARGQGLQTGVSAGDFALHHDGDALFKAVLPAGCFTHTLSDRLNGALRSPVLPAPNNEPGAVRGTRISFEVLGQHHSDVKLVTHHCQLADDVRWQRLGDDRLSWVTFKMPEDPVAVHAYAELTTKFDNPKFPDPIIKGNSKDKEDYRIPWDKAVASPRSSFGLTRVVVHDETKPPKPDLSHWQPLFDAPLPGSSAEAADRYTAIVASAVERWTANRATDEDVRWIDGLLGLGLLTNRTDATPRLSELAKTYRSVEREIVPPRTIHGLGDAGAGVDHPLFVRGDCLKPMAVVPRRFLEVLSKPGEQFTVPGSGRLELATRIASGDNPLTARVMVNRLWQHVFGEGIVRTVDDFGHNGEQPSHPELLDHLAHRFVEDGWSMKRMIRALVLTKTFQQTNRPSAAARAADPENRLLHHYPARRMEAEAIRDAILMASGRLDLTLGGASVDPFREREISHQRLFSGPLDGKGRRSLYVKRTLMEPPKFLEAFNLPKGGVMQGRRDVTNVPAQALALLNDPFLLDQARVWAEKLTTTEASVDARIERMFRVGLGRPPERGERARFAAAVKRFATLHEVAEADVLKSAVVWRDVAHTFFNLKEFIYIP